MYTHPPITSNHRGFLKSTTLLLIAFSTAFYSRIFCAITRAPSPFNFLHFITVPLALIVSLTQTKTTDRKQIEMAWALLSGLFLLFAVMIASALLNSAGVINVLLDFLLLAEPFMLLLALVCIPMSPESFQRCKKWVIGSSFANMALAFIQWPLLKAGRISAGGLDATDGMGGVFFPTGAGNYVSTTVSLYFGLYYLNAKTVPLWIRIAALLGAFFQLQLSDSKQVLFALFAGWLLLILANLKDIKKTLIYLIGIIFIVSVFYWCVQNLEAFAAFKNYADKEGVYGSDGAGTLIKTAPFRIISSYYQSPLNWFLGLGPGHTVGRLGGWMLKDYWSLLGPLGATIHPASEEVWKALYSSWIALESTMFSPFFGWAGIWGDLGFLGLGAYLYLSFLVWHYLCLDNLSKFLLLSVFGFGLIFTQMEEPGYMLFTATLIGLRWQEHQVHNRRTQTDEE
jgi:hypothetical protein